MTPQPSRSGMHAGLARRSARRLPGWCAALLAVLALFSPAAFAAQCQGGGDPIAGIAAGYGHTYTTVENDTQLANGTSAATVLVHIARVLTHTPCAGVSVQIGEAPNVDFGEGRGRGAVCRRTDGNGDCRFRATSSTRGSFRYATRVVSTKGGEKFYGTVNFVDLSSANSRLRVTVDHQPADGSAADVLEATIRSHLDTAMPNLSVDFSGVGSCTTDGNGRCTVRKTSTTPGTFTSTVTAAGIGIGRLDYHFLSRGLADRSGVRVLNDHAPANGRQANVLEALVQDGSGQPVGDAVVDFGPAGEDVAFDGARAGAPGRCTTAAGSGTCRVSVTSTLAGEKRSRVSLAGAALAGAPSAGGAAYAPSPAVFQFTSVGGPGPGPGVSGRIFSDTGSGGGIANNGIPEDGESGVAGLPVSLGDCRTTEYASTRSDAAGRYFLPLPAGLATDAPLCVDQPRAGGPRFSTGASADATALAPGSAVTVQGTAYRLSEEPQADRIAWVWSGGGIAALNFAGVPASSFIHAGTQGGRPGQRVDYGHLYTAGSAGSVSFPVTASIATPPQDGWSERVYADPGCTGRVQPGAALLFPPALPQALASGQQLCLVLQETVPVQAAPGHRNQARLRADLRLDNAVPPRTLSLELDDVTLVASEGVALLKEVRNLSQGSTGYGLSNAAKPGETLEYRITYANHTPAPVQGLAISDSTPAYTTLVGAEAGSTPASLGRCRKTTPADPAPVACDQPQATGGQGTLAWTFDGPLQPGATGTVLFRVRLD